MSTSTTTTTTTPPSPLIPSLPDDIAINILARIPRSHHPNLSLVSKPIRSLLSSPLFYTTRFLLHSAQPLLYLPIRLPAARSLQWFTLWQNSPNPRFPRNILIPVPPIPIPSPSIGSAFVAVGPVIYVIGGSINDVPSSQVWVLDCRFHTWQPGPSMRVPREFSAAGVVDDKIFVMGGCLVDSWSRSKNWAEVLEPEIGKWESVDSSSELLCLREKWMHASAVIDGKLYAMADRGGVVYEPRMNRWGIAEQDLDMGWKGRACVIDKVLYCYDYLGKIRGFDMERFEWRELKGLEKKLPRFLCGATMANFGGNLVVVWERKGDGGKEIEIWCAEIEVEKGKDGELLGKIEWCDLVLKVPNGSFIINCLAVSV